MRLSTVILPTARWTEARERWRRAEELGFFAAYTYDHHSWGRLQDRPWFGAIPALSAAAVETSRIRLGTLVTSPNFRHPVPLAKDLMSVDDLSQGRLTIGIGSGGTGNDATAIRSEPWSAPERSRRFQEFVGLLDQLLREPVTNFVGAFYEANEVRMLPGSLQQPRPPFCIAANGPAGLRLAARLGDAWVTLGLSTDSEVTSLATVRAESERLDEALVEAGRRPDDVPRLLLDGFSDEQPLASVDAFVDWAGRYREVGISELVIHWPEPDSLFACDVGLFERIATDGLAQVS